MSKSPNCMYRKIRKKSTRRSKKCTRIADKHNLSCLLVIRSKGILVKLLSIRLPPLPFRLLLVTWDLQLTIQKSSQRK